MEEGRSAIAWGCFNWQTMHAFLLRTEPEFPRSPPLSRIPTQNDQRKPAVWYSFPLDLPPRIYYHEEAFLAYSKLMLLLRQYMSIRDNFAPLSDASASFENAKLLFYQLLDWAKALHSSLILSLNCLPMVFNLHLTFHQIVVELFRPFATRADDPSQFACGAMNASLKQIERILYVQQVQFAGPPLCGSNAGPIHSLMMSLFDKRSETEHPHQETDSLLLLCTTIIRKIARYYPSIGLILHSILAYGKKNFASLPDEVEAIYRELDATLTGTSAPEEIPGQYPIDLKLSITRPEEANLEAALKATYELRIHDNT
ncbi:hypothetical protein BGZ63DRAFT_138250 [Mariannaea sp. PMI_226]|nr:hypothetical protein BGZ63DRAFT_138250 [Mariannaea sp. PMI_226]